MLGFYWVRKLKTKNWQVLPTLMAANSSRISPATEESTYTKCITIHSKEVIHFTYLRNFRPSLFVKLNIQHEQIGIVGWELRNSRLRLLQTLKLGRLVRLNLFRKSTGLLFV